MIAGLLLALLLPVPALGHHILGIPHYRYDADYPQIPFVEVIAQTGAHELDFTYFPGTPKPGEDVRFKLYVRNTETDKPYTEPLQVQYVQKRFFGADLPLGAPVTIERGAGPDHNDYKFYRRFDAAEAFEVRLSFPTPGGVEVIPFPVTIGVTDDRPLIGGAVGLLLLTVIGVAVAKRRKKRRAKAKPGRAQQRSSVGASA